MKNFLTYIGYKIKQHSDYVVTALVVIGLLALVIAPMSIMVIIGLVFNWGLGVTLLGIIVAFICSISFFHVIINYDEIKNKIQEIKEDYHKYLSI